MSQIFEVIKSMFRQKSDLEMAVVELEDAKRHRLQAHSAAEYARAMGAYHTDRIKRLEAYIQAHEKSS